MATAQEQALQRLERLEALERLNALDAADVQQTEARRPEVDALRQEIEYGRIGRSELPIAPKGTAKVIDDFIRGAASGMSFGFADEAAAFLGTLAEGEIPSWQDLTRETPDVLHESDLSTYERKLEQERLRDRQADPYANLAGQVAGGAGLGTGMVRSGLSLTAGGARSLPGLVGRGAAEGALYGGAYGFGEGEGLPERAQQAALGGGLGAVTGGVLGGLQAGASARQTMEGVEDLARRAGRTATDLYEQIDASPVRIAGQQFRNAVDQMDVVLKQEAHLPKVQRKLGSTMKELRKLAKSDEPLRLKDLDMRRRMINNVLSSGDANERRMAYIVRNQLDDMIDALPEGEQFRQARQAWAQKTRLEDVEALLKKADLKAGQYTQSGDENALRTVFRNLAHNEKKMARYSPEEQQAIRAISEGTPVGNAMRFLGRFSLRGPVSALGGMGMGYVLAGPAGAAGSAVLGEMGRRGAEQATRANVGRLVNTIVGETDPLRTTGSAYVSRAIAPLMAGQTGAIDLFSDMDRGAPLDLRNR